MSRLWTPPKVARELVEQRREYTAMLDDSLVREKMLAVQSLLDEATYRVRAALGDERLEVTRAPDDVPLGSPVKASYYCVVRWNEGAPPTVIPLTGPDGEFIDLDGNIEAVIAMLRRNDFRNPDVRRRFEEQQDRQQAEIDKERERDNEERREELKDRVNAMSRVSVSMNRDTPWSQNAAGQRKRERKWRSSDIGRDRWR